MNNGLKNLGQILKDKRKEKDLSLKSLSLKLKISVTILEAIEEAKTHQLPAFVYLRGFILAYGRALDLDEEELLKEIQSLKPSLSGQASREEEEFIRGSGLKPSSIFPALGILFVLAVVLVVANIVRGLRPGKVKPQSPPPAFETALPSSSEAQEKLSHQKPSPGPPADRASKEGVEIVVKALSEVRLFYRQDEEEKKSLNLSPDQFEVLKGQRKIWIETKNSDQVEVFKNGKSLGIFGSGEKKSQTFAVEGAE